MVQCRRGRGHVFLVVAAHQPSKGQSDEKGSEQGALISNGQHAARKQICDET